MDKDERTKAYLSEVKMSESVYKIIKLVITTSKSWEKAAVNAITTAAKSLKNLYLEDLTKMEGV